MEVYEIRDAVDRYQSELFRYCLSLTQGNSQASEEIMSEVFLLLVEKQDELYSDDIRAWLYRSAEIFVRRYRTGTAKQVKRIVPADDVQEEYAEDDYSALVSERDIEKYVRDICEQLTPDELRLYEYRYTAKMKLAEISQAMNLPYSTLYDKYRRLNRRISDIVKEITDEFIG